MENLWFCSLHLNIDRSKMRKRPIIICILWILNFPILESYRLEFFRQDQRGTEILKWFSLWNSLVVVVCSINHVCSFAGKHHSWTAPLVLTNSVKLYIIASLHCVQSILNVPFVFIGASRVFLGGTLLLLKRSIIIVTFFLLFFVRWQNSHRTAPIWTELVELTVLMIIVVA